MVFVDRREFIAVGTVAAGALLARPAFGAAAKESSPAERFWPQWRGPLATGEAPHAKPPLEWSDTKSVRWKVELPGQGKSSPVIWRDLIFLTTAVPTAKPGPGPAPSPAPAGTEGRRPPVVRPETVHEFRVLAIDRADGRVRWSTKVHEEFPHEGTHQDGSFAGGSVVTDGTRLFASFGSRGIYALDLQGKVLWGKDLGEMQTRNGFGEGASPALHDGVLVVNWDHEGEDFVVGFDAATGKEKWRQKREEPTGWSTPHVVVHQGKAQVVIGGTNAVRSYDIKTGEAVWEAPGLTANVIPSPVSAGGLVFAMSGFRGNALRAVRLADAKGSVTAAPALAWSYDKDTPYVPSPLLYRGHLYFLKSNSGILSCLEAATGTHRFTERLEGTPNVYASPVAADGRIYVAGREGTTVVLEAGSALRVLATNKLDDGFDASPALVDGEVYLRGKKHLYRISA